MADDEQEDKNRKAQESVSLWQARIQTAYKRRDDIASKHRWDELIDKAKGVWSELDGQYDIPILPLNLVFAFIKTELPALYSRDPYFKANPKKRTTIWTAKILEAVLNAIWRTKMIKREIKKAILDALIIGHAWFKTGYTGEFGTIEMADGETHEYIEKEDFFGYRVPWKNIVFDEDAVDPPHDCSWICHSVWMSVEDVKRNPRFINTDKIHTSEEQTSSTAYGTLVNDPKKQKVRVDEVWDIKNKMIFTLTDGSNVYLEEPKEWTYEMRGFPFSYLQFNPNNDEPYGVSDIEMFLPQILELMKLRSAMLDHLKRFGRQMQADNAVDDNELAKLSDGVCGAIVKGDLSKGDIIKPINYPQLQPDAYAIEERLKEDAIRISGQTPLEQGGTSKTSTRAVGELRMIQQGAQNRRSDKVEAVETFMEDIAQNLVSLVKQFATMQDYVQIVGQQSPELQKALQERPSQQQPGAVTTPQGFTFTKEDIEGEFDVALVAGSSTPIDRTEKKNTILTALELLPKLGLPPGSPIYATLGRMLAEEFDMPEILQAIDLETQRQMQQMAQQKAERDELKQLQLGQIGAEHQLKAEQAATKQTAQSLELAKFLMEQQNQGKQNDM